MDEASMREGDARPIGDMEREPGGVKVDANKEAAEGFGLEKGRLATDWEKEPPSPAMAARAGVVRSGLMGTVFRSWAEGSCLVEDDKMDGFSIGRG